MGIGYWFRRPTVTVFVDDYVLGKLPGVCVVTGVSTPSKLHQRRTVNSPGGLADRGRSVGWRSSCS